MSVSWPDPFKIISLGQLPMPTGYEFLFVPIPPVLIAVGLFFGIARHRRRKANLKGLVLAAAFFVLCDVTTIIMADQYTLTYGRDHGCPDAGEQGLTLLVPLFSPEPYHGFLPSGARFDGLQCREFESIMWTHAKPGLIATLVAIVAGLAATCFSVGTIFSWLLGPIAAWQSRRGKAGNKGAAA